MGLKSFIISAFLGHFFFPSFVGMREGFAQAPGCPSIDAGLNQSLNCTTGCTTLSATLLQTGLTTDYSVSSTAYTPPSSFTGGTQILINIDDVWGPVINLPFNFCFYGNMYNQIVVGANGLISFDASLAGQYCEWSYSASIPTPGPPPGGLYNNSIMGAYHDMDPSMGGDINYYISGTAPCRMFIVNYSNVPHFECDCFLFNDCKRTTQQIVIYETTNVIEVYIQQKQTCTTWNSGNAVIGIQNSTGTAGVAAPGRNTGPWSAANEAWRFTPDGAANYTVTWYDSVNTVVGTGVSINICPSATTEYTAEGVYQHCDGSQVVVTDTVTIYVAGGFTTSMTNTNTTCSACLGTATITATGGTPPFSFNIGSGPQASGNFSGLCAGNYSVTVTDSAGCMGTVPVNIITNAASFTITSVTVNLMCNSVNNGSIDLSVSGGAVPYTFLWSNGAITEDIGNISSGTYKVTITDNTGCSATDSAIVTEPAAMVKSVSQTDVSCSGSADGTATINISGGTMPYAYTWSPPISLIWNASNLSAGNYLVTVTDANNCTITNSFTITQPAAVSTSAFPVYTIACSGDTDAAAAVSAGGGIPPFSYLWSDLLAQTNDTAFNLPAGNYVVQVTDANGCQAYANVSITEPSALFALVIDSTAAGCSGSNDGTATAAAFGGTPPYLFLWSDPANQVTTTATGLTAGTYSVTATDANNCSDAVSVTIAQANPLSASVIPTDTVSCNGSSDGQLTVIISGGTPVYSYLWSDVNSQTGPTATGLATGKYYVTVIDANNCVILDSANITEPPPIIAFVSPDTAICIGGSADISVSASGGTPPLTFVWDHGLPGNSSQAVSPSSTDSFAVIVTDANFCSANALFIKINVNPPLAVLIILPGEVCTGNPVTLTAQPSGGNGIFTYWWDQGIGQAGNPVTVTPLSTTIYSVNVDDGCETPPATASVTVIVNPFPVVMFSDSARGCAPLAAKLTDTSSISSGSITQWNWNFGGGSPGNCDTTQPVITCVFDNPGSYSVTLTVTSDKGCSQTLTKPDFITVFPLPQADFSARPWVTSTLSPTVTFTDLSEISQGYINSRYWDFDDSTSDNVPNPVHTFKDTGFYTVCLTINSDNNCSDSICRFIIVKGEFSLFTPTAFSPNNDGKNDFFLPVQEGAIAKGYEFMIFDRWGDLVFETTDPAKGWNGIANNGNNEAQQDIYVWVVYVTDINEEKHRFIGHIALVK